MVPNLKLKPPIFLTGCGRSGTSLLQKAISRHKNIFSFAGETHFFGKHKNLELPTKEIIDKYFKQANYTRICAIFYEKYEQASDIKNLTKSILSVMLYRVEVASQTMAKGEYPEDVLDTYEEVKNIPGFHELKNKFEVFNFCANYLTTKVGKKRWIDKSPLNLFSASLILELYPHAKFVQIYRDPRGVFYSWTNCPFYFFKLSNSFHCLKTWKRSYDEGEKLKLQISKSFYQIRYEDIVNNPDTELTKLCIFLEEDYDPDMKNVVISNSSFNETNGKFGLCGDPLIRWKRSLTQSELLFVNLLTKEYRHKLGYTDMQTNLTPFNFLPFTIYLTKQCIKAKVNPLELLKGLKRNARTKSPSKQKVTSSN